MAKFVTKKPKITKPIIKTVMEVMVPNPRFWAVGNMFGAVILKEIHEQELYVDGDPYTYLVGYNENGNVVFEIRKVTANITYFS